MKQWDRAQQSMLLVTALDGTISGSPDRRAGVKGGAFYFDGLDDKIVVPYDTVLALEEYTVSFWYYPERRSDNTGFTGIFGRGIGGQVRNYAIWQGDSTHATRPYIHHRFTEGQNYNEGVANYALTQWKKWYHVACTNQGLAGHARTYVNGTFTSANQRYDHKVSQALTNNDSANLHIGVFPDNENGGFFQGMIDDVRLYGKSFGSEDIQHLYSGDSQNIFYKSPREESMRGSNGTVLTIETPLAPTLTLPSLRVGDTLDNLSIGTSQGHDLSITGLPNGLNNIEPFSPREIPGLFAWYQSDRNDSFNFHSSINMDRNDTVAKDDLLLLLSFDESNGSHALDKSGNAHHGKPIDQSIRSPGKFGNALKFDGENDGLAFSKISYLDIPDEFSISLWFFRDSDINGTVNQTNHGINNLMVAQSSASDNDNLEIGTEGSEIEIYLDSGTGAQDMTYTTSGANITNNNWHHLVVTYGSDLKVFSDGTEVLQLAYDGPLDSAQDSPLSLGMARIFSDQWGDFNGSIDDLEFIERS